MRHHLRGVGCGRQHGDDLRADVDEGDAPALDDAVPHVHGGLRPHLLRIQPAADGSSVIYAKLQTSTNATITTWLPLWRLIEKNVATLNTSDGSTKLNHKS